MPIIQTEVTVTTWVCDLCSAGVTHIAGTGASLSTEHFIDKAGFRKIDNFVACRRCRPLLETATKTPKRKRGAR